MKKWTQVKEETKDMVVKTLSCIPCFTIGIIILVNGDIERWQFGALLAVCLIVTWNYEPSSPLEEMWKKNDKKRMETMEKMKIKKMIRTLKEAAGSLLISSVNNDEVRESMEMIKNVVSDLEEWEEKTDGS